MTPVFRWKIKNIINELRLTKVFLLVGLFLLMSGKGWGQLSSSPTATPGTVCAGANVQLDAVASGGSGSYTYIWTSDPVGFTSSISNPVVNPTVTTTYKVAVFDGSATVNSQVVVTVNALPVVTLASAGPLCIDATDIQLVGSPAGGTYSGSGVSGTGLFTPATAGSHIITYIYTDGNNCTSLATTTITVNPLPNAAGTITGTPAVCQGQAGVIYSVDAIVNATGYIWTLPAEVTMSAGNNTNNITVDFSAIAASGDITVQGSNSCGIGTVSTNYPVTVNPLPSTSAIYHQ